MKLVIGNMKILTSSFILFISLSVLAQPNPGGRISGGGGSVSIFVGTNNIISSTNLPYLTNTIGITVDGGGAPITTGVKGYIEVPYACTIISATLMADQVGGCGFNVWRTNSVGYPPLSTYKISAAASPVLTNTNWMRDTTLTGWTTGLNNGDFLGFNVESNAIITRATLQLKVTHLQ